MELEKIELPVNNAVLVDYLKEQAEIHSFFNYRYEQQSFEKRVQKLQGMDFQHRQLSEVIRSFMTPFGISSKVEVHLNELANGAVAVVGGQQAGVMTGPLYAVHKAITVLKLAQEQREKLQIPVVPIFWIAGEDHDLDEINHTYTIVDGEVKKRGYSKRSTKKTMASTTPIDQQEMAKLIKTVFKDFGETTHTEQLLELVMRANQEGATFTTFFTQLMNDLFKEYGLLMIDAAYGPFRRLEAPYFERLIEKNEAIANVVVNQELALSQIGYNKPIDATVTNANLFFVKDGERFLLERQNEYFVNASARIKLSKEALIELARNTPEQLSNNVVTRPLMQEMTIPVLAFVGGPGELAYWATLKEAFNVMELDMPIFAPRLHIALVTRQVQRYLAKHDLTVDLVMRGRVDACLEQFIASVQDDEALAQIDMMRQTLLTQYETLSNHLIANNLHVEQTTERNKQFHLQQFDYLASKVHEQTLRKHEVAIAQFNTLRTELYPQRGLQERVFNPYQYMNEYGLGLIDDLMNLNMTFGFRINVVKY